MSARPWRIETRMEGASAWHPDRNWGAFASTESAGKKVAAWRRYSGTKREYRAVSVDTAEVISL